MKQRSTHEEEKYQISAVKFEKKKKLVSQFELLPNFFNYKNNYYFLFKNEQIVFTSSYPEISVKLLSIQNLWWKI